MRRIFIRWSLLLVFLLFTVFGCSSTRGLEKRLPAGAELGGHYYTQYSFQYEQGKNLFLTTNYRRGVVVPINTEVELVGWGREGFQIRLLPGGPVIEVVNVAEYSGDTVGEAFHKLLGEQPVDLSQFSDQERKFILLGTVAPGMRKKAVLAALGYPPAHKTPSLQAGVWRYWSGRNCLFTLHFQGEILDHLRF